MKDSRPPLSYRCPPNLLANVTHQNKAIISLVGHHITRLKQDNGMSDESIAKLVGCSRWCILKVRHGTLDFCSITLLTKIAAALGCDLLDWLKNAPIDSNSVFGSNK